MELRTLMEMLAVILNHAPKATAHADEHGTDPDKLLVKYNGPLFLVMTSDEAEVLADHRVGLYDGYAEIML